MRILVADDDPSIRRSLAAFLNDARHEVLQAANGIEALQLVEQHSPDLVLLDLRMPRLDGQAALEQFVRERPEMPVIVISGVGHIAEAIQSMRKGAWDYLTKPIDDLSVLLIAIDAAMEKRELRRQVREHQEELEHQVSQRTAELRAANLAMEQKATALREVLNVIQDEKRQSQQAIIHQIETGVLPLIRRASETASADERGLLEQIRQSLAEIASPFMDQLSRRYASLTPSELRICRSIRAGMTSKEIAHAEGSSVDTVETHRKNIRRKLNIANEHVNLAAYLQSLDEIH